MDVFDLYLIGEVDAINWDFYCGHLDDRLKDNGINFDYVKNLVLNEEPTHHNDSDDNRHEVFFKTPKTKDYDEIKLIFACKGNSIDIISIMPNTSIGTFKNQTKFDTEEKKDLRKKTSKAHAKREKMH